MDKKTKEAKSIVAKTKGKITYLPNKGVMAEDKSGVSTSFILGTNIEECLVFPYILEEEEPEVDYSRPLYMFFDETLMVWTAKEDKTSISMIKSEDSFVWGEHELIGMKFDSFQQLDLLRFDYVREDLYLPGSNDGVNFKHYQAYYNKDYELSAFVWKDKIRSIILRDLFFSKRFYEDDSYLKRRNIKKLTD